MLKNCAISKDRDTDAAPGPARRGGPAALLHPALVVIASAALGRPAAPAHGGRAPTVEDQDRLLAQIRTQQGPAGLLAAGRHLDLVATEPVVLSLLNADGPAVLLDKIARLNRYLHANHRHAVLDLGPTHVELEHRSVGGPAPTADQSLFVCGLYLALLERIGCTQVECAFPDAVTADTVVYRDGRALDPPGAATGRWSIRWSGVAASRVLPGLDDVLLRELPADLERPSLAGQAAAVLRADLGRTWRVGQLAAALAVSPRTLQRRLRSDGTTFSQLLTSARIDEATRLLAAGEASIGDIGYATGFADTAHFTRTFKQATGLTPTAWWAAHVVRG